MNEYLKTSRDGAAAKAKKLTSADPHQKVDSSTWTPPEELNAGVKTGARPLTKRRFKSGGTVCGDMSMKRADRKARKSGGRTESEKRATRYLTPDNLINRDDVMANEARDGKKHVGAYKKGGRTKKAGGGAMDNIIYRDGVKGTMTPDGKFVPIMPSLSGKPRANVPLPMPRPAGLKKGGKASKMDWEHSKEDLKQDKKLAKKHGMSMEKWEGSKLDEKHDEQQSAEGLKKGGSAGLYANINAKRDRIEKGSGEKMRKPGAKGAPSAKDFKESERTARKAGGRTKSKGKTHINVTVNTQPQGGAPAMPPMGGPILPPTLPRPPMPPMGAPTMPPPGAGGPPMPPMGGPTGQPGVPGNPLAALAAMGRKSGGRTNHPDHVINHAAGGGLGRLEKIKAYGEKPNH